METGTRMDHPRSRGVYRHSLPTEGRSGGSSPLARGLLLTSPDLVAATGIIPARAGFTAMTGLSRCGSRDHPRSRGVYRPAHPPVHGGWGSSPLARGLRRSRYSGCSVSRIIPARAGFTENSLPDGRATEDHPRSRGVYDQYGSPGFGSPGSSPLARGLRPETGHQERVARIIPARAGFTPRSRGRVQCDGDHPRSRGVYQVANALASGKRGSSPLARGLPGRGSRLQPGPGIIPARAGFTVIASTSPRPPRDHPRSRGVYLRIGSPWYCLIGSSPLARGLHMANSISYWFARIIPARAGFTRRR